MIVGTVREIKNEEYRVGLTPEGAHALVDAGHTVLVEKGAGAGVLAPDDAYCRGGRDDRRARATSLGAGGPAREGEGAAVPGVAAHPRQPDAVHVPAPRGARPT